MDRTFDTPEPVELYIELGSGLITTRTTETSETTVEVTGPRAEEFVVEQHGRRVSVLGPKGLLMGLLGRDHHDVTVTLPSGSDLSTKAGSADTRASGSYGRVQLSTGSGDVQLEDAEGPVLVQSGSGDVRGSCVRGELRAKSGSGDVDLGEVFGEVGISTGSGDIAIGRAHAKVTVKSGSGDTEIGQADGDVTLGTASGRLVVARVRAGSITATNVSGDVRVGVPAGVPVWTDISSVTGRVESNLESLGAPQEGQEYVEVRATTVSGTVRLQQV